MQIMKTEAAITLMINGENITIEWSTEMKQKKDATEATR